MKYERYNQNKPLKKPIAPKTTKTIYRAVNVVLSEGSSDFIPTYDSTDHFHFACEDCETMLDVLQVDFSPYPQDAEGKQKLYALLFYMGCPNCGKTGIRKIYLKPTSFMGEQTVTSKNKRLIYGTEPKALDIEKLKEAQNKAET